MLLLLAGGMAWWRASAPDPLPLSDQTVTTSTKIGRPVYVGVFAPGADFGRTLHLSGVKVHATSNTAISLTPLLCRGGSIVSTTEPTSFCTALVNPEGQDLAPGDAIVLQVVSDEPAVAVVDRVRLAFREHLHTAVLSAGSEAVVRVLPA